MESTNTLWFRKGKDTISASTEGWHGTFEDACEQRETLVSSKIRESLPLGTIILVTLLLDSLANAAFEGI